MREGFRMSALTAAMFLAGVLALVFLVAPFVVLLPNAFSSGNYLQFPPPGYSLRWFENFFADDFWTRPAVTSVRVATAAAIIATVTGTAAAIALDRWEFRGRNALLTLLLMPLVVPFVITGIAAYTLFVSLNLYGSSGALIVAHALVGMPYVVLFRGRRLAPTGSTPAACRAEPRCRTLARLQRGDAATRLARRPRGVRAGFRHLVRRRRHRHLSRRHPHHHLAAAHVSRRRTGTESHRRVRVGAADCVRRRGGDTVRAIVKIPAAMAVAPGWWLTAGRLDSNRRENDRFSLSTSRRVIGLGTSEGER